MNSTVAGWIGIGVIYGALGGYVLWAFLHRVKGGPTSKGPDSWQ